MVRDELAKARISQAEACRRLDVSTKHMNQMLMGHAPLTLEWAERILALCGKHPIVTARRIPKKTA
jgi:plasmid maintenance system antidote protein VapI